MPGFLKCSFSAPKCLKKRPKECSGSLNNKKELNVLHPHCPEYPLDPIIYPRSHN